MSDELRIVRTFMNAFDAELARGALEAAGIDSMVRADDCGGVQPLLWLHGIELLIRDEDVAAAEEVLSVEPTPVAPASVNE